MTAPARATPDSSGFSATLRTAAAPLWARQAGLPFLVALADGSLPTAKFLFYTAQDAYFLREMNRVFGYAAARADQAAEMGAFAGLLIETERILADLHGRYAARQGVGPEDLARVRPAATTYAYSRHLLAAATADTYPALLAALLPSMWMYDELGRGLAAQGPPPADHPYREWLILHAGPHLDSVTAWMRAALDRLAVALPPDERARLTEVFLISSRYEIMFWEMAWAEAMWPV
jgi:thiaminase (transcriptional activator TenA)